MTAAQIKLIHVAARQLSLNDDQYRTVLRNIAGVESCKHLDNATCEDVMAFLESLGFTDAKGAGYWAARVGRRARFANERMVRKIEAMCAEASLDVGGFCWRMSDSGYGGRGRTRDPNQLDPRDAYNIIEALKVIVDRNADHNAEVESERDLPGDPSIPF